VHTRASRTDILARKSQTEVGGQVGELNGPRAAGRARAPDTPTSARSEVGEEVRVGVGLVEFKLNEVVMR